MLANKSGQLHPTAAKQFVLKSSWTPPHKMQMGTAILGISTLWQVDLLEGVTDTIIYQILLNSQVDHQK